SLWTSLPHRPRKRQVMKRLSIGNKIQLIIGVSLVFSLAAILFLLQQIGRDSDSYQQILAVQVRQQDKARNMEVEFKRQVQEWKDILLRGHDPKDLDKYRDNFFRQEVQVRKAVQELRSSIVNADLLSMLEEFNAAHNQLGEAYRAALQLFIAGKGSDPRPVDKLVRGQDRAPTELIDRMVQAIAEEMKEMEAAQQLSG